MVSERPVYVPPTAKASAAPPVPPENVRRAAVVDVSLESESSPESDGEVNNASGAPGDGSAAASAVPGARFLRNGIPHTTSGVQRDGERYVFAWSMPVDKAGCRQNRPGTSPVADKGEGNRPRTRAGHTVRTADKTNVVGRGRR